MTDRTKPILYEEGFQTEEAKGVDTVDTHARRLLAVLSDLEARAGRTLREHGEDATESLQDVRFFGWPRLWQPSDRIKATLRRERILEILKVSQEGRKDGKEGGECLSVETIHRRLGESGKAIPLSTVHAVLGQFKKAGVVQCHRSDNGEAVFELTKGKHDGEEVGVVRSAIALLGWVPQARTLLTELSVGLSEREKRLLVYAFNLGRKISAAQAGAKLGEADARLFKRRQKAVSKSLRDRDALGRVIRAALEELGPDAKPLAVFEYIHREQDRYADTIQETYPEVRGIAWRGANGQEHITCYKRLQERVNYMKKKN